MSTIIMGLMGCAGTGRQDARPSAGIFVEGVPRTVRTESVAWINPKPEEYRAWPSVIRTRDGVLLAVYSGGREGHVCPFGRVELMWSTDDGATWSEPEILVNSPMDDRDAGILETSRGALLVTWFTSTAYVSRKLIERAEERAGKGGRWDWPEERLERWRTARERMHSAHCPYPEIRRFMEEQEARETLYPSRQWLIRSEDGGRTWSEPYPAPLMSPNGPKETAVGRLQWAGRWWTDEGAHIGLAESLDDGLTWEIVGRIPPHPEHDLTHYHELDLVDCDDGTLLAQIRNHDEPYRHETLQTVSHDGGRTWSEPRSIGVWGFPSHLLRLPDETLLMTYSHRGTSRRPREDNQTYVRFSADPGNTWSEPQALAPPAPTWDFGYPTTAALPEGRFLTLWYQVPAEGERAQLIQAIWGLME